MTRPISAPLLKTCSGKAHRWPGSAWIRAGTLHQSKAMEFPGGCMQLIRWGVIGPGRAAGRFALGLQAVEGATLAAVWGRNRTRGEEYAGRFGVAEVADTLAGLLDSAVDAIYVATHPDTHAAICIEALAAGKHVMCEKPAALNVRELEAVLAAARYHDRLFMEAMKPPFYPLYRKLRAHLAVDPIGQVGFVRAAYDRADR